MPSSGSDDSILDTDLDAWRRVQEVNLTSVYRAASTASRTCSTAVAAR